MDSTNQGGRPEAAIDYKKLESLAELGCTNNEIAAHLNVSVRTVERLRSKPEFLGAIERGAARANVSLRRKQLELALAGDRTMLIWLGKQRLGQQERIDAKEAAKGETPPPLKINVKFIEKKPGS